MNAYAITLSKYMNTGLLAAFTLLAFLSMPLPAGKLRRGVEIVQRFLLAAFLINSNLTIALLTNASGSRIYLLCAMEILFLLAFMVLYRIVYETASMLLFNNICMLLSIGFVIITRIACYGTNEATVYRTNEPIKQFVMASAGLLCMLVIPAFRRFFDMLRHFGFVFGLLGIAALGGVLLLSAATNGAMITYTIAGFTFQPSEFVKILYILMLAGMLSGELSQPRIIFVSLLAILHVGILVLSRDLGSALIFFAVYLMMLFFATGKWAVIFSGAALGIVGSVACFFLFSHVRVRVEIWQDPFAVIESMGYQIAQALFAISYGGLWGAGLTQGAPDRIPFVESDFIFAAIAEEMGLVFSICLLLLCINCFLRILLLSAGYSNRFFQLFTYGAAVCYIFQTFLTVGGETKFIPLTGVTLPLVSYGGSSVLSTLIMFGIIEMIFILHDERTAQFMERYEQEHALAQGSPGQEYSAGPEGLSFPGGGYTGRRGGDPAGGDPSRDSDDGAPYGDVFPENGISEEGIFDDYMMQGSGNEAGRGGFFSGFRQGQDLDGRR